MYKNWKSNKNKKIKNAQRGSTPGITKGESCQASPLNKSMAKNGRSYRDPLYKSWSDSKKG